MKTRERRLVGVFLALIAVCLFNIIEEIESGAQLFSLEYWLRLSFPQMVRYMILGSFSLFVAFYWCGESEGSYNVEWDTLNHRYISRQWGVADAVAAVVFLVDLAICYFVAGSTFHILDLGNDFAVLVLAAFASVMLSPILVVLCLFLVVWIFDTITSKNIQKAVA